MKEKKNLSVLFCGVYNLDKIEKDFSTVGTLTCALCLLRRSNHERKAPERNYKWWNWDFLSCFTLANIMPCALVIPFHWVRRETSPCHWHGDKAWPDNVALCSQLSNGELGFNDSFVCLLCFGPLNGLVLAGVLSFFSCFDREEKQRECRSTSKPGFLLCAGGSACRSFGRGNL